jgi:hypothetical protein
MLRSEVQVTRKLVAEELIRSCGAPADLRLTILANHPRNFAEGHISVDSPAYANR